MYEYNELNRVEKPAIDLFHHLGYETENAYYDKVGPHSILVQVIMSSFRAFVQVFQRYTTI